MAVTSWLVIAQMVYMALNLLSLSRWANHICPKIALLATVTLSIKGYRKRCCPSAGMLADGKKHRKTNRHTGYKVVVVDDDEEIRNYLKEELGEFYHVSVYTNGHEAALKR